LIWHERKFALAEGPNLGGRSPEAAVWLEVPGGSLEHARPRLKAARRPWRISAAGTARFGLGSAIPPRSR
jgi:hypothetical protein